MSDNSNVEKVRMMKYEQYMCLENRKWTLIIYKSEYRIHLVDNTYMASVQSPQQQSVSVSALFQVLINFGNLCPHMRVKNSGKVSHRKLIIKV